MRITSFSNFSAFSPEGVVIYSNPNFLSKNESPFFRREPLFIKRLFDSAGNPHILCPVRGLEIYLRETSASLAATIFVDPVSLRSLPISKIRLLVCTFIRWADPGSFPKAHDLRKVASSFAFLKSMSFVDICDLTGWASFRVFKRHYLQSISDPGTEFVAMGSSTIS